MKVTLLGAAGGEVTGSSYLVESEQARVLVDFGMFQGSRTVERLNQVPKILRSGDLDAVLLTHAHLDHVGRLGMLASAGYRGPIYGTRATHDLAELILNDAARLSQADIERENRKRKKKGVPPLPYLFNEDDVQTVRKLAKNVSLNRPARVAAGMSARWVEAGHMLGSGSIELTVEDATGKRVLVFSGDIGPRGAPFLKDPAPFSSADVLFMESTYGDRDHKPLRDTVVEALDIIRHAVSTGGKILVPTFAVGRAQNLLYVLAAASGDGALPMFPVYLDSPMAIEATAIYGRHKDLFDDEAIALERNGFLRARFENVIASPSSQESRKLNELHGPCMILAGNGMCTGGRILHHLRHNLSNPSTTVMIVGYQSEGSVGRRLVDGEKTVRIFGESIRVRAKIHTLGGFSAHAGQTELLQWLEKMAPSRPRVVLTHGEDRARLPLARLIKKKFGISAALPALEEVIVVR